MEGVIGFTTLFAGNFAPKGWALCQGQLLPISQNTALFSILGSVYGGDGRVTFALPNLMGRTVIGQGSGPGLSTYVLGEAGGTQAVTLTPGQLPPHTHPVAMQITPHSNTSADSPSPANCVYAQPSNSDLIYGPTPTGFMMAYQGTMTTGPAGGNQPFSNQEPVLALNYIVCMSGVFPSRN